jgi:hypothetical protein
MDKELHLNYHINLMEKGHGAFASYTNSGETNFSNRTVKNIEAMIKYLNIYWKSDILVLDNCAITNQYLAVLIDFI